MKVWLVSDTHFNHTKLVEWKTRENGFEADILGNLYVLSAGDVLIHTGDFCIGRDEHWTNEFMETVPPGVKKILVRGNHDNKSDKWYIEHGWDFVCEEFHNTYFGRGIQFTHIPMQNVPEGMVNIHGHLHDRVDKNISDRHKLVSMEWQGMRPILLKTLLGL